MLFPDFSAETHKKRRSFVEVHHSLSEQGLQYGMLYPSRLCVHHQGMVTFFGTLFTVIGEWDPMIHAAFEGCISSVFHAP